MSDSDSDSDVGMDFAAIEQTSNNISIEEANKLNRQKLTAIMRSNDKLKKEVKQLKKEGSDNYRVKQIKNLRQQLRETQAISDALTKTLMNKSGMNSAEIGELYDEILSQPKLAKPNNPVQLKKDVLISQQQMASLERELAQTKRLLREYRTGERKAGDDEALAVENRRNILPQPSDSALAEQLRQLKLQHDITLGEVETKTRVIALHRDMCTKLQAENRELRQLKMQWDVLQEAKINAEEEAAKAREEVVRNVGNTEEYHQDIRELRTKLASIMAVRDKVEQAHQTKVNTMQLNLNKVQDREQHLLAQIQLLRSDLKSAHDSIQWYRQQAQILKSTSAQGGARTTESDQLWELQQKYAIVSKDLRETKLELRSAGGAAGKEKKSEVEKALHDRIAQLQTDNANLSRQMDVIERKYLTYNETAAPSASQLTELQTKYNAVLKELDEKHVRFQSNQSMMNELSRRNTDLQHRLEQAQAHLERGQADQKDTRVEFDKYEKTIAQLKAALAEKGAYTARSVGGDDDDEFANLGLTARASSHSGDAAKLQKELRKSEETHLEHVAKLMRNFEIKEKEMLFQIAKLQETLKPGSGNKQHLNFRNPYANRTQVQHQQQQILAQKQFNLDSDSEDEDDDDDDDEL